MSFIISLLLKEIWAFIKLCFIVSFIFTFIGGIIYPLWGKRLENTEQKNADSNSVNDFENNLKKINDIKDVEVLTKELARSTTLAKLDFEKYQHYFVCTFYKSVEFLSKIEKFEEKEISLFYDTLDAIWIFRDRAKRDFEIEGWHLAGACVKLADSLKSLAKKLEKIDTNGYKETVLEKTETLYREALRIYYHMPIIYDFEVIPACTACEEFATFLSDKGKVEEAEMLNREVSALLEYRKAYK